MNNRKDFPIVLIALFNIDYGVRCISSFLKAKGYCTYIILFNQLKCATDFFYNDYFTAPLLKHQICPDKDLKLLIRLLRFLKPKLIGISVTSVTMRTAQRITSEIKKNMDTPVVWGGIHAIICPEECIQYADITCIGEGEIPMWELAEQLKNKIDPRGIKNLWIKNNGLIEKNEISPLIENLDTLPFPDFIEEGNKFLIDSGKVAENPHIISPYQINTYPIMTSRGCMFSCAFCCNSVMRERYKDKGHYLRRRSVDNVLKELRLIIEKKPITSVRFWDDVFTYDKAWIEEFYSRFVKEIGKPFLCYAHPKYTDRGILVKLVKAGLTYVAIGIQSGSESVSRDVFYRIQSNQDIFDFAEKMKELHIGLRYDIIVDNPYETELDQDNTVELLLELPRPFGIQIYSLCYFPQTPLTKKALNDNLITNQDLEQHSSKALNNFYMFLSLSRNKEQLFWNCIKAMAVNSHFPANLVRLCKRNSLFKRHPQLLVLLCRNYLHIFKFLRKEDITKLYITFRNSYLLFVKQNLFFTCFPLDNMGTDNRFCLRVTNKLKKDLSLQLLIELYPLMASKNSRANRWRKMRFEIKSYCQTDIHLNLEYPELYFSFKGIKDRLELLKIGDFEAGDQKLCILKIRYRLLGRLFSWGFNYWFGAQVLCNV